MTIAVPETRPTDDPTLPVLTVEEAARRLRVGRTTMYALIRTGAVKTIPIGRLRRVPAEALTEYVQQIMQHSHNTAA
ncbi:helix-turn-helix domain-containing protein [Streptomyces sp. NPDC092296]|uniref:helix-turn-helix domain-containing protein n=1 Tax=Streptomyces sp. NPDC092296 TaxID=3366012 RepID=UPI003802E172